MRPVHAISVDLEEWFSVYNFSDIYPISDWPKLESRAVASTLKILDLFDKYSVKATFFVLGWIAEREPDLIREIERRGHEIATHGYGHGIVKNMGEDNFRIDLQRSLEVIGSAVSYDVIGFRAPSFSVDPQKEWIFSVLSELGIKYDSSIFPVAFHPDYANGSAPLVPYEVASGIKEFPLTCLSLGSIRLPAAGGGYFRMLPYQWFKFAFKQCERSGRSGVFYFHPWEIDPDQPRVEGIKPLKRFRHYVNLHKMEDRLERLLKDFSFSTMRTVLDL